MRVDHPLVIVSYAGRKCHGALGQTCLSKPLQSVQTPAVPKTPIIHSDTSVMWHLTGNTENSVRGLLLYVPGSAGTRSFAHGVRQLPCSASLPSQACSRCVLLCPLCGLARSLWVWRLWCCGTVACFGLSRFGQYNTWSGQFVSVRSFRGWDYMPTCTTS